MIRSMTGFGAASVTVNGAHYSVEIRSLNNKYFKAQIRLPEDLQGLEAEIDAALSHHFNRGSVVLTVRCSDSSANAAAQININAVQRYLEQLLAVPGLAHNAARIDLSALLSLPGVVVPGTGEERVEQARGVLLKLIDQACDKLQSMRLREGRSLHAELHRHCEIIREHLKVIVERVPITVDLYQQRLRQRVNALLMDSGTTVRDEDLLREVAFYAERSDIAEEVARLGGHLDQFLEIIDAEGDEPSGRTLDFLTQELLREANTIGSKCLDVEVSRRIVEIKGGIDRIKEQVQNVE
ncbi:MAG TPA: YicC family protein [Phycisphaerales bacterium]|nr:YicC family protein [Phycisphaerales bacterium]HRQ75953.1 YicC family protein [Phycisphaerales bacterium]